MLYLFFFSFSLSWCLCVCVWEGGRERLGQLDLGYLTIHRQTEGRTSDPRPRFRQGFVGTTFQLGYRALLPLGVGPTLRHPIRSPSNLNYSISVHMFIQRTHLNVWPSPLLLLAGPLHTPYYSLSKEPTSVLYLITPPQFKATSPPSWLAHRHPREKKGSLTVHPI